MANETKANTAYETKDCFTKQSNGNLLEGGREGEKKGKVRSPPFTVNAAVTVTVTVKVAVTVTVIAAVVGVIAASSTRQSFAGIVTYR